MDWLLLNSEGAKVELLPPQYWILTRKSSRFLLFMKEFCVVFGVKQLLNHWFSDVSFLNRWDCVIRSLHFHRSQITQGNALIFVKIVHVLYVFFKRNSSSFSFSAVSFWKSLAIMFLLPVKRVDELSFEGLPNQSHLIQTKKAASHESVNRLLLVKSKVLCCFILAYVCYIVFMVRTSPTYI